MDILSFDSFDDMQAQMAAMEEAANASLTPMQISLRDTEDTVYWVRPVDGMVVYGETPVPEDDEFRTLRARGYLTGMAYSKYEPNGEHGDTHVAQVIPVSPLLFRLARLRHWPDMADLNDPDNKMLARALAQAERIAREA